MDGIRLTIHVWCLDEFGEPMCTACSNDVGLSWSVYDDKMSLTPGTFCANPDCDAYIDRHPGGLYGVGAWTQADGLIILARIVHGKQ